MKRYNLAGLVVLNIALLAVLALVSFDTPQAEAQLGGMRGGNNYVMVSGRVRGSTQDSLYITDVSRGAMLAITYDQNQKNLKALAWRDIGSDFTVQSRR
ncbi:MAG: hypothetical protein ACYTGQ_12225 [Planctomycetota bacterium]|jgi:hypothetical protein